MPFRLTPQFTNLLLPHKETGHTYSSGQLRSCMVHTLRALRNSQQLLLNMMDVFVKEPALDWKVCAEATKSTVSIVAKSAAASQLLIQQGFFADSAYFFAGSAYFC